MQEVNSPKENSHHGYMTLVVWIVCFGALCFGYNTAVVNGALDFMAKADQLNLTTWGQGLVSSGLTLGAAFGAVIGTPISEKLGRKKTLLLLGAIFTVFGLLYAIVNNQLEMIIVRFIMGLAVGSVSALVPVYIAEISPADERGKFVSMDQLLIVGGQFLAYVVNSILGNTMGAHDAAVWRLMFGIAAIPGILLWLGMYLAPESPQWYANKGNYTKALQALARIRTKAQAEAEVKEYQANAERLKQEQAQKASVKDFKKHWVFEILLTASCLGVFQQFSGINSVMYYGTKILQNAGFGESVSLYLNIANGVFSVLGAVVGMYTVDRWGRKALLLIGYYFSALALIILASIGNFALHASWAPYTFLVVLLAYILVFQATVGSVTWTVISEIFPLRYRSLGTGFSIFILWLCNWVVALVFPTLLQTIGMSAFYIFAIILLLAAWFVTIRLPETKGIALDDIESFFHQRYDK
jgi:major inositol transporter-like SP family MFS transporter